jgi:polar amino acid transport system permease protein
VNLEWSVVWESRYALGQGALMTIFLTIVTMALAIPGGILLATMRLSPIRPLRVIGSVIVEFFRNLPLILLIYWAYYVLPMFSEIQFSALATGLIAMSLSVSAYNAETFRAGINSIRKAQVEAAYSLGMTPALAFKEVTFPLALRRVLPVLASTWVSLFKDTSLVSVIAIGDLSYTAMTIRSDTFRVIEVLTAMAALYWMMGYPQAKLVNWIYKKFQVSE